MGPPFDAKFDAVSASPGIRPLNPPEVVDILSNTSRKGGGWGGDASDGDCGYVGDWWMRGRGWQKKVISTNPVRGLLPPDRDK